MIKLDDLNTTQEFNEANNILSSSIDKAQEIKPQEIKSTFDQYNAGEGETKLSDVLAKIDHSVNKTGEIVGDIDKWAKSNIVSSKSIVARATNSILQFPIYISGPSIRTTEAHIIAKSFERVYATLVQTVLSQNQTIEPGDENGLKFLKQFHTNIREATDVFVNKYYEPIDDFDRMMCESIFYQTDITDDLMVEFKVVPTVDQNLIMESARLANEPLSGLLYLREADDNKPKKDHSNREITANYNILSDKDLRDIARDKMSSKIHTGSDVKKSSQESLEDAVSELKKDIRDGKLKDYEYDGARYRQIVRGSHTPSERTMAAEKRQEEREISKGENDRKLANHREKQEDFKSYGKAVDSPKFLRDSDIRNINGMLPYTIEATFRVKTKDDQYPIKDVKFIIGIKSILHLINPKDIAEDLREIVTGKVKKLQKVRYKTGEIKFRDYWFNIKNLKADAAKHINYDKRWLNTLKRLGEYESAHGSLLKKGIQAITGGNVPVPNGTLILSKSDVLELANTTGIDLGVASNAKRLCKSLFLIAFVIVDGAAGSMKVLFPDSSNDWDTQSLASIDAEVSKTDNSNLMKELNKMVNR